MQSAGEILLCATPGTLKENGKIAAGYRLIAAQNKYIDIDRKLSVKFHMRIGKYIRAFSGKCECVTPK